jgi:quercetin dioxygenase-like cupin family protein
MSLGITALGNDESPAFWFLNTLTVIKSSAGQANNAFALVEQLAPAGYMSPYHVHRAEDEAFYVLEGQLEFVSGDRRWVSGPGSYVFLPRDIPHAFRVAGQSPSRFLVLVAPAGFEGFVREMGEPAISRELPNPSAPDLDKLIVLAAKYRIEILGPYPE